MPAPSYGKWPLRKRGRSRARAPMLDSSERKEPVVAGGDRQTRHREQNTAQHERGDRLMPHHENEPPTPRPWITPRPATADQAMGFGDRRRRPGRWDFGNGAAH